MDFAVKAEQELAAVVSNRNNYTNLRADSQNGAATIEVAPRTALSANSGIEYTIFAQGAYNRAQTKHLIERGESIIEALIDSLTAQLPTSKPIIDQLKREQANLVNFVTNGKVEVKFEKPTILSLDIDFERSRRKFSQADKDRYLKAAIKETDKYISKMLQRIVPQIQRQGETHFAALQRIKDIEIQYRSAQGRPTYIAEFTIPKNTRVALEQPLTLITMQKPIGYYTDKQVYKMQQQGIFPADRHYTHTSKNRSGEGMANFVQSVWGHIEPETGEFKIDGSLIRGGWIPIDVKDPVQRRAIGLRCLEQQFTYLAKQAVDTFPQAEREQVAAKYTKDNPLVIPLSSMSLLSMLGRLNALDPDHQFKIAEDNHYILGMINSEPFEIKLQNGQTLYVKADVNELVMGVNANRYERVAHKLQSQINHRNFNNWMTIVYDAVLEQALKLEDSTTVNAFRDLIRQDWKHSELKYEIKAAEAKLAKLYAQLKQAQDRYENSPEQPENKQYYKNVLSAITAAEAKLDHLHQRLLSQRKQQWQQQDAAREALITKLQQEYQVLKAQGSAAEPGKTQLQGFINLVAQLNDVEELFHTKRYYAEDPKDNYAFQAKYIVINQALGRNPQPNCKSNEDRTGEAENRVIEMHAVKAVHDFYPRSHSGQENTKLHMLSRYTGRFIHEFAASAKNTEFNAKGAGGLQLHDKSSWWQKLIFGGNGDGNGYKHHKEGLLLAKREKVFFKESLVTKILRKVLPFIPPKAMAVSWTMWLEDLKINIGLSKPKEVTIDDPKLSINLNPYRSIPSGKDFETELANALQGRKLPQEFQELVGYFASRLNEYHQFVASNQGKQLSAEAYWRQLNKLSIAYGTDSLKLLDALNMLYAIKRADSNDTILLIGGVVARIADKIKQLTKSLEPQANLYSKQDKAVDNIAEAAQAVTKPGVSLEEVLQRLHARNSFKEQANEYGLSETGPKIKVT